MTSPATTCTGLIIRAATQDPAETGADTEGAQGEAIRGVWVTTSEGHLLEELACEEAKPQDTQQPLRRGKGPEGSRRWPRSDIGRLMAVVHAALEWSSMPSGHVGWPWPNNPPGLCVQPPVL